MFDEERKLLWRGAQNMGMPISWLVDIDLEMNIEDGIALSVPSHTISGPHGHPLEVDDVLAGP